MRWQIERLDSWPYPVTRPRLESRFRASWSDTLALLEREVEQLGVRGAVAIRASVRAEDVRLDGMLRANARPSHPGVAVSFTCRQGSLTYPCDTYTGWQDNVRAIAKSLEALRAVDRYGVAGRGEQYAGWRAIGSGTPSDFDTAEAAIFWLRVFVGRDGTESPASLLRAAAKRAHPDSGGGKADWARVDAARQLLRKSGAVS